MSLQTFMNQKTIVDSAAHDDDRDSTIRLRGSEPGHSGTAGLVVQFRLDRREQVVRIRFGPRAELGYQHAVAADQVFVKIPGWVGSGRGCELIEKWMRVALLYRHLLEHGKLDAVGQATKLLDLLLGAGLLAKKVI